MEEYNYTIIIPHKNIPKLLQRCLDSIPERPDVQVIVVDDNSDPAIVDFGNFPGKDRKNTEVYLTKEGKGAGYARNVGLRYAKGKWLLFADADDYYNTNFIGILDIYINSDNDIVFFNISNSNAKSSISTKYENYFEGKGNVDDIRLIWVPWNKMFSCNLIKRNNICFDEIPVGNDAMFCLNANNMAKKISVIKEQLYVYTSDNTNSISLRKKDFKRIIDYLKINIVINRFLRETGKRNHTMIIIAPKILSQLFKQYGLKNVLTYLFLMGKEGVLFIEISAWIKSKFAHSKQKTITK